MGSQGGGAVTDDGIASVAGDAVFRAVRAGNVFEDTVARLLQSVRLGIVEPGDALPPERELAARLGVSRDTVREALRSLADAGLVEARRGRYGGTFVTGGGAAGGATGSGTAVPGAGGGPLGTAAAASPEEIDDVLGLREILETGAARAAASRSLSAAQRELLWVRLRECSRGSVDDYRRLDSRLHLTIGELAGAPSLVPLLADNRMRVNELLDRIPLLQPNIQHSNDQHEAVVIAVLTGDAVRAADAVREHLAGSAALLRGFLA